MFLENVIFEIFSYLDLKSLVRMTKVCRKFRKIALRPGFYRNQFFEIFLIEDEFRAESGKCRNWVFVGWELGKCIFEFKNDPFGHVLEWVFKQLASPQIPLPKLRKESVIFSTVFQDIFAYFYSENSFSKPDAIQNYEIAETANTHNQKFKFLSVKNEFFTKFSQLITTYCQGIREKLFETSDLLKNYLDHWENYSFSSQSILEDFLSLFPSNNPEILRFYIQLPNLFIQIWTNEVYYALKAQLNEQFFNTFMRSSSKNTSEKILCQRFFEALVDLSVNEFTVHFKEHSKVELQGPVKVLEDHFFSRFSNLRKETEKKKEIENILFVFYGGTAKRVLEKCCSEEEVGKIVENWKMKDYLIEHNSKKLGFWETGKNSEMFQFYHKMKYVI